MHLIDYLVFYSVLGLWIGVVMVGLGAGIWALQRSRKARQAQAEFMRIGGSDGENLELARDQLRHAQAAVAMHLFFTLIGFLALGRTPTPANPVSVLYSSGFIVVAGLNVRAILLAQLHLSRMLRTTT